MLDGVAMQKTDVSFSYTRKICVRDLKSTFKRLFVLFALPRTGFFIIFIKVCGTESICYKKFLFKMPNV